jgi:hypothetical protein
VAAGADATGLEYFEKHVRPALVEHCYRCHSPAAEKGIKGGLRLDTREGWMKGGDTGPAIVPGQPDKSLLIRAIRYADEQLQMPPKGKRLPPETVAHFEAWVSMGAPDPRTDKASGLKPKARSSEHWAFRPVTEPPVPAVKNRKQVQTPVDNFLLARLEEKKLKLSPPADRRTLIRRASFDLTGLPPTAEEVQHYEADSAPGAFARVVDRLLASPQYGERWGRYWLDVARYADTKGYVFEEERRYPYSYTYRDWVIRAFNEDLSYDQFLVQQLAADQLGLGDDKRPLAALGFLTLGRRFLNNQPDIIDDRIDVVCRGTMALTVGCARCHDHKFDPIPMKDYYSLYGVFASTHEPRDLPLLGDAAKPKDYDAYVAERTQREQELTDYRKRKEEEVRQRLRGEIGDYLLVLHDAADAPDEKREQFVRERKLEPAAVRHFQRARRDWSRGRHAAFVPWFELEAAAPTNFAARVAALVTPLATADGTSSSPGVPAGLFDRPDLPLRSKKWPAPTTSSSRAWTPNGARSRPVNPGDRVARRGT